MKLKGRLSASIDEVLITKARDAVARGRAASLSAWVADALRLKQAHDERLEALERFVTAFEVEHGEISDGEMRAAWRRARGRAVTVRGLRPDETLEGAVLATPCVRPATLGFHDYATRR